jgi:dienelactone hydrolase
MGYVTLAPEAMPFGDRRLHVRDDWEMDHKGNLFWDERVVASECWLLGETLMGRQIWELMGSVDLLQSLPQVDPNRIGSIGCSQGGIHTWWLSILDKRIGAGVVSAAVSNFSSWIDHRAINALMCYIPGILKLADQDELLATIAPRPLLLLDCAQDCFFPREGMERVWRFLGKVYRWHDASRNFTRDLDPNGHGFPERQQHLAFQWLKRHLFPSTGQRSLTSHSLLRRAGFVKTNGNGKVHGRLRLPRNTSVG